MKQLLFISHVHSERDFAIGLETAIRKHYRGAFEIFVSSNSDSGVPLGKKLNSEIIDKLKNCNMILICCSKESINRPWIHFEAGAGTVQDIPVVPVCYGGLIFADLPSTIVDNAGVDFSNRDDIEKLNQHIAKVFDLTPEELPDDLVVPLMALSDTTKERQNKELSNAKTDKEIVSLLVNANIGELNKIIRGAFFGGKEFTTTDITELIAHVDNRNLNMIPKNNLMVFLNMALADLSLSFEDANADSIFTVFSNEYNRFSDNLKTAVGLIKYKDDSLAKKMAILIAANQPLQKHLSGFRFIINSDLRPQFQQKINDGSYLAENNGGMCGALLSAYRRMLADTIAILDLGNDLCEICD